MVDPAAVADRGGVWPVPFERAERILLQTQAKKDRRDVPAVWYWRRLHPDDSPGSGAAADEVLDEEPDITAVYAPPVAAHLFIDWTKERKGQKKGRIERAGTVPIGLTRAEARRLGRLFGTRDDAEGLSRQPPTDLLFVPRADDVFLSRGRYYEIVQLTPEWWGATSLVAMWMGTGAMTPDDMTRPGYRQLPPPPTPQPPLPEVVPWPG